MARLQSPQLKASNVIYKLFFPNRCRYFLAGADMNAVDYDGRSALHVAASEGHLEVIKFLMENTGASCLVKDR